MQNFCSIYLYPLCSRFDHLGIIRIIEVRCNVSCMGRPFICMGVNDVQSVCNQINKGLLVICEEQQAFLHASSLLLLIA